MPRIGQQKKEKIQEQILFYLYNISPKQVFTVDIAREIARDEEFTKFLMLKLQAKGLVVAIRKNPKGINYLRRIRWRISNKAYDVYKEHQKT